MTKRKADLYPEVVRNLMAEKTNLLFKAQTFTEMALPEIAGPLWTTAAAYEERLAPLLEGLGQELEAAIHRISAASCYQKAGDLTRAVNLYRAALAGPLHEATRGEITHLLAECLTRLTRSTLASARPRQRENPPTKD